MDSDIKQYIEQIVLEYQEIATLYETATNLYRLIKITYLLAKQERDSVLFYQAMASEQEVPEIPQESQDSYEEVEETLDEIHDQLKVIHGQLERLILKTKTAQKRIEDLNKVELIVRRYNNLS
jgi:hypothetical protein